MKSKLILALAAGEVTQVALSEEFGVTQAAVSLFAKKYRPEIEAKRERLDDEWYGLWIADKRNRVAEYQDDVERINEALDNEADPALLRAKLAVMRQVAEELGQLKEQVEITGKLTYVVEGIDPEKLR